MFTVLVEDDRDLREEIVEYLRRRGHEVSDCGSFAAARQVLAGLESGALPEAVICDVNLSDGSGVDLCREMAPRMPNTRWLLMSGAHEPSEVDEKLAGIPGPPRWVIIDKPMSLRTLNRALEGC